MCDALPGSRRGRRRPRYPASVTLEIIRTVEASHLPTRQILKMLGIPGSTYRDWCDRWTDGGVDAPADRSPRPKSVWNRIPDKIREDVVDFALEHEDLTPRGLARSTCRGRGYGQDEASSRSKETVIVDFQVIQCSNWTGRSRNTQHKSLRARLPPWLHPARKPASRLLRLLGQFGTQSAKSSDVSQAGRSCADQGPGRRCPRASRAWREVRGLAIMRNPRPPGAVPTAPHPAFCHRPRHRPRHRPHPPPPPPAPRQASTTQHRPVLAAPGPAHAASRNINPTLA